MEKLNQKSSAKKKSKLIDTSWLEELIYNDEEVNLPPDAAKRADEMEARAKKRSLNTARESAASSIGIVKKVPQNRDESLKKSETKPETKVKESLNDFSLIDYHLLRGHAKIALKLILKEYNDSNKPEVIRIDSVDLCKVNNIRTEVIREGLRALKAKGLIEVNKWNNNGVRLIKIAKSLQNINAL